MLTFGDYVKNQRMEEVISEKELKMIEAYLDKVFGKLGIDVEFTKHFRERLNDARNGKSITKMELVNLFKKEYEKYGKTIAQLGPDKEAVLTDLSTDVNTPIVLKWNREKGVLELTAKTVMRKKSFKPNDPKEKQFKVS